MKFPDSSFPDSHINLKKMVPRFLQRNPLRLAIVIIVLINIALHLGFYNTLGFHRDELLYFSLGRHLSAGYASVPPLTGFMAFLMINTVGSSLFAARLLPSVFSGIMVILAVLIARELQGGKFAQIFAAIGMVILPLNLRAFYMFQPVFLDIFFWTLIFLLVLRFINTRKDLYLYLTGIATGFAFLNKYLILLQLFAIISVFIFTLNREIFRRRSFWISLGIAFIIALPNITWQVIHDFPAVTHMQALNDSQLVHGFFDHLPFFFWNCISAY
jgi:4-amino-4-deoxy-L-arabinose transferase-like glycosyltransferase